VRLAHRADRGDQQPDQHGTADMLKAFVVDYFGYAAGHRENSLLVIL
jgi:hypothetical protein